MPRIALRSIFELGQIVATPGATAALGNIEIGTLIMRHSFGDWGEVDTESKAQNNEAMERGEGTIFSVYTALSGARIWVITEADRSVTTLLLPDEY